MPEISSPSALPSATAFDGHRCIASGSLIEVALAVKAALEAGAVGPMLTFDDGTGRVVDLDLRGSEAEIAARLNETVPPRGRGRPKLGVVAREVTLLPRHWEWLAAQPGGASVALRRLVDQARRAEGEHGRRQAAREAAYRFMSAMAGDLPGFEEAARALFAGDRTGIERHAGDWPADIRSYLRQLSEGNAE